MAPGANGRQAQLPQSSALSPHPFCRLQEKGAITFPHLAGAGSRGEAGNSSCMQRASTAILACKPVCALQVRMEASVVPLGDECNNADTVPGVKLGSFHYVRRSYRSGTNKVRIRSPHPGLLPVGEGENGGPKNQTFSDRINRIDCLPVLELPKISAATRTAFFFNHDNSRNRARQRDPANEP